MVLCSTWAILMKSHQRLVRSLLVISQTLTQQLDKGARECASEPSRMRGERCEVEREGPQELFLQGLLGGAPMEKQKLVDDRPHQAPPSHEGHWEQRISFLTEDALLEESRPEAHVSPGLGSESGSGWGTLQPVHVSR